MPPRKKAPSKSWDDIRRERELAVFAHRVNGAMAGKGVVRLTLRNGAELTGAPTMRMIDPALAGRHSNLRLFMSGYDFPLDDVVACS